MVKFTEGVRIYRPRGALHMWGMHTGGVAKVGLWTTGIALLKPKKDPVSCRAALPSKLVATLLAGH